MQQTQVVIFIHIILLLLVNNSNGQQRVESSRFLSNFVNLVDAFMPNIRRKAPEAQSFVELKKVHAVHRRRNNLVRRNQRQKTNQEAKSSREKVIKDIKANENDAKWTINAVSTIKKQKNGQFKEGHDAHAVIVTKEIDEEITSEREKDEIRDPLEILKNIARPVDANDTKPKQRTKTEKNLEESSEYKLTEMRSFRIPPHRRYGLRYGQRKNKERFKKEREHGLEAVMNITEESKEGNATVFVNQFEDEHKSLGESKKLLKRKTGKPWMGETKVSEEKDSNVTDIIIRQFFRIPVSLATSTSSDAAAGSSSVNVKGCARVCIVVTVEVYREGRKLCKCLRPD